MKTAVECLPCFMEQTLRVLNLVGADEALRRQTMREIAKHLKDLNYELSPPENAVDLYLTIADMTGCMDPYSQVKREENIQALSQLPVLRKRVLESDSPLLAAMRIAIAGNIIDYGVSEKIRSNATLMDMCSRDLALDHRHTLLTLLGAREEPPSILYLADNCGEIVYDCLLIELLADRGCQVTVAVKESPIINDALLEDALRAGIDKYARIITNGTGCPGSPLAMCSQEFKDLFWSADVVIAKGQGNFETLSDVARDIFFFLTVKCKVVGKHLTQIADEKVACKGKGEMVVFYSQK